MTIDLETYDAMGQAELVARGELREIDLVEAAISRIEAEEPRIAALSERSFDMARDRARAGLSGPFRGVPFLLKDLLPYPGQPCRFGSRLFREHRPAERSPFVRALDAAGLVVVGRTKTSEFGLLGSTETLLDGPAHNPHDLARSATGSSGGSAAAVASGMVPMAHASDGGGSIRIPASACGVFGMKPGRGCLVSTDQPSPMGIVIDHAVTRTVRDSAMLFSILESPDQPLPKVGFVAGPSTRRLRIAAYDHTLMGAGPDDDVRPTFERTVALCRDLGHDVVEASAPAIAGAALSDAFFTLAGAGMHAMRASTEAMIGRSLGSDDLEPFTLELIAWFRTLPADAVERALATATSASETMLAFAREYDVLLTPTMPCVAPVLGTLSPRLDRETLIRRTETLAGYTPIHNMAGMPAMSVPLFRTAAGLPVGSHFAASPGGERTLFELAYELEAAVAPLASQSKY